VKRRKKIQERRRKGPISVEKGKTLISERKESPMANAKGKSSNKFRLSVAEGRRMREGGTLHKKRFLKETIGKANYVLYISLKKRNVSALSEIRGRRGEPEARRRSTLDTGKRLVALALQQNRVNSTKGPEKRVAE